MVRSEHQPEGSTLKTRKCKVCDAAFDYSDIYAYVGHVSKCKPRPPGDTKPQVRAERKAVFGRLDQRTDGHKSWVRGSKPGRSSTPSRAQRMHIYADNYRRDDRGRVVRPMPNMSERRVLHGRTQLDQDGLAAQLLNAGTQAVAKVSQSQTPFGAGV